MSSNLKSLGTIAVLLLGALSFGTVTSYPSPAIMSLSKKKPQISEHRFSDLVSWFSNAPRLSAGLGPFLIICILPRLGRKYTLALISFLLGASWFLLFLIDQNDKKNNVPFNLLYGVIMRTIMGLFWGTMSCLTVTFLSEISPVDYIGLFGSLYQLFIILGICLNNILGAFVDWKILIIVGACINILFTICLLLCKDSPTTNKLKLQRYHLGNNCMVKCSCFCCVLCNQKVEEGKSKSNLFITNKTFYKTVASSMVMLFFQQYCGVNAILNNLSSIMSLSGLNLDPNIQSALSTLAQFLACFIACFLMDTVGARKLWTLSSIGCLLALVVYAYCIFDNDHLMSVPGYIPVLSVFVYCLFFGIGQGPAPWAVFPDSFPDILRYEGICMMMLSHWVFSFVVCYTHPIITEKVGEFYAILIYIICSAGAIIYGLLCIPKKIDIDEEAFAML